MGRKQSYKIIICPVCNRKVRRWADGRISIHFIGYKERCPWLSVIGRMKKRKWCYVQPPTAYDIACDICGGNNITWSEYEGHVWCYDCEKDTGGTGGIFDGPIPYELTQMLGISFDKIDMATGKRLYMKDKDGKLVWE